MKVKIFTEAGSKIGLGHISRCSALYDEIRKRGFLPVLIIQKNSESFENIKLLSERVFEVVEWQSENYLNQNIEQSDFCIVDSYYASLEHYTIISQKARKTIYIDDYGRLDYPEGIIVNPSLYVDENLYKNSEKHNYLLGADYIILRPSFVNQQRKKNCEKVAVVLIMMGGSDLCNLTPVLTTLLCQKYPEIKFNIILGNTFDNFSFKDSNILKNVEYFYNANAEDMRNHMLKSDFAITAAGQSIYELLALGIPFLTIQIAENQNNNIKGLMTILPNILINNHSDTDLDINIINSFEYLLQKKNRKNFSDKVEKLIDGLGSKRIIAALVNDACQIKLRKITNDDCMLLFKWANDENVRKNAFENKRIELENHKKWFENKMNSENSQIYIGYNELGAVGQIRIDIDEYGNGLIDYSIDEKFRGLGYGEKILIKGVELVRNDDRILKLIGRVKFNNIPSQKAFVKAGFLEKKEIDYIEYFSYIK